MPADAAQPPAAPSQHDEGAPARSRRRTSVWLPSILLCGAIVLLTLLFMLGSDVFKENAESRPSADASRMPAIDQPYSGKHPTRPGDRGGWEQLALLGTITVALAGGAVAVVHSSRKARRRMDAPTAPGASPNT